MLEYGFKAKSASRSYVKSFDGGKGSFHLTYTNHPGIDFDVSANVAVRVDAVEEILTEDDHRLTEKEKKDCYTIGINIGNLVLGSYLQLTVTTDADLEPVATKLMEFVPTVVVPYIEKNRDLEAMYDLLTPADPKRRWDHRPGRTHRARTLLALSVLLGRADTNDLIDRLREEIQPEHQSQIEWFEGLVRRLGF